MVSGFVGVMVDAEIRVAELHDLHSSIMSNPGPPLLPSTSVDPTCLSPPTSTPVPPSVFYSLSTSNRPFTPPQNATIPTRTPISSMPAGNHSYASETPDRD